MTITHIEDKGGEYTFPYPLALNDPLSWVTFGSNSSVSFRQVEMRCPVYNCGASIKSKEHKTCPYHAPCHQDGTYDPTRCPSCNAHLDTLTNTHSDDITASPAWKALDSVVRHLRHAVFRAPHLGELEVQDQRIIDWFPRAVWGSQAYQETGIPRTPGRDMTYSTSTLPAAQAPRETDHSPVTPGPDLLNRLNVLEQSFKRLSGLPDQVQAILTAVQTSSESEARRSRSVSLSSSGSRQRSKSPPRKAPRHAAPNSN